MVALISINNKYEWFTTKDGEGGGGGGRAEEVGGSVERGAAEGGEKKTIKSPLPILDTNRNLPVKKNKLFEIMIRI